ncbi:hypothetical protein QOT38_27935, partial [Pseudomonas aeruginosa]
RWPDGRGMPGQMRADWVAGWRGIRSPEAHQYLQDARCLLQSGNAGERLRVLKASLLRLTPIENLSVVQDGQALGQARFDLVLAHEHVLLVDLERTASGQASGGTGGTAS